MAARVLLLGILFTEALRPACLAGVKGTSGIVGGLNASKSEFFELERSGGLSFRLETKPSGNVVVGRKGVTLRCLAGVNQNVTWLRNDVAAPPCGQARCVQQSDGSLHFYKMVQKRRGRGSKNSYIDKTQRLESYRCVAENTVGSLRSSPVFLQIADLSHEFNKLPRNVTVQEGEVARLSCHIESIPFPPNITWRHDEHLLSSVYETKYFMVSPGVLYINATKPSDTGSYRCVVTNEFLKKTKTSKTAVLHVVPKLKGEEFNASVLLFPQISYNHQPVAGSDLTLVCASSGFPSLMTWKFIPRSKDVATIQQPRLLFNSTNSIVILPLRNLTTTSSGIYQCSVKSLTLESQTQNIIVDVLVPPTFLKKPMNQVVPNGRNARFECQAQGFPMPQIYWLKDSVNLTTNPREKTYIKENNKIELAISSTVPSDSGIYQCVAVNTAGEIWTASRLQVTTSPQSPSVPTSLNCHATSSDTIFLSWEQPQTVASSTVRSYITVHYGLAESGSREDTLLPDENASFIEIKSLEPFTNYTMYVRMWNVHGASNQSNSVQCSTAPSVPIAAPAITVKAISTTKLNVSWLPLNKKEARGFIVEYKLQWRLQDHPSSRVRNLLSSLNYYILTDLIPGTRYEVRILARTKQGWPNVSDSQFNWTSVMMPQANSDQLLDTDLVNFDVVNVNTSTDKAVIDLEGVPASSTSINVTWSTTLSEMEHCYEVCYNTVHSIDSEPPKCFNTTDMMATVTVLKPFTLYQFKVRVLYNTSVDGDQYREIIECYTNEDGAVREVQWFLLNITEVRIVWKQPTDLNGVIRNYTVSYITGPVSTPLRYWTNVTVAGNKTATTLPGLLAGTRYIVEIRAATSAGYGHSSDRLMIYTANGAQDPTESPPDGTPSPKPLTDESLGIIVGVSISAFCIIICLSSIYCRKKWENTQTHRASPESLKDQVLLRNGNGCCIEQNSVSTSHRAPVVATTNQIELAVLCPHSPKSTNPHSGQSSDIVESCV